MDNESKKDIENAEPQTKVSPNVSVEIAQTPSVPVGVQSENRESLNVQEENFAPRSDNVEKKSSPQVRRGDHEQTEAKESEEWAEKQLKNIATKTGIFKDHFAGIQSIFSSIQSVALIASLAFTAYWSIKVLKATEQELIAEYTVDKLNNETEKLHKEISKLQLELSRKSAVYLDINAEGGPGLTRDTRLIRSEIIIRNNGIENIEISTDKMKFYAAKLIKVDSNGNPEYGQRYHFKFDYPDYTVTAIELNVGSENSVYRALAEVPGPGIYLIRFRIPVPNTASESEFYHAEKYITLN